MNNEVPALGLVRKSTDAACVSVPLPNALLDRVGKTDAVFVSAFPKGMRRSEKAGTGMTGTWIPRTAVAETAAKRMGLLGRGCPPNVGTADLARNPSPSFRCTLAQLVCGVTRATAEVLAVFRELRGPAGERLAALGAHGDAGFGGAEVVDAHAAKADSIARGAAYGRCADLRRSDRFGLAADHTRDLNAPLSLKRGMAVVVAELIRVRLEAARRTIDLGAAMGACRLHVANYTIKCTEALT